MNCMILRRGNQETLNRIESFRGRYNCRNHNIITTQRQSVWMTGISGVGTVLCVNHFEINPLW